MILTGKCKKDFGKWIYENDECYFTDESMNIYNNALIIEFFDSVGIYVNVLKYGLSEPNKWVVIRSLCENNLDFIYSSRQEATIQAIIKANDIYNERFK